MRKCIKFPRSFSLDYLFAIWLGHGKVPLLETEPIPTQSTGSTWRVFTRVIAINLSLRRADDLQRTIVNCLIKVRRAWQDGREWRTETTELRPSDSDSCSFIHRAHRVFIMQSFITKSGSVHFSSCFYCSRPPRNWSESNTLVSSSTRITFACIFLSSYK